MKQIQTVPERFESVRNRVRPYLFRNGTDPPVHITNRATQTVPEQFVPERDPQKSVPRIRTERYRMSDTFTDVEFGQGERYLTDPKSLVWTGYVLPHC